MEQVDGGWLVAASCGCEVVYEKQHSAYMAERRGSACREHARSGERNPFFGKTHSAATRAKISAAREFTIASYQTEQFRNKIRDISSERLAANAAAQKGKTLEELYGDVRAAEIRARMSKASSGANNPMYGKPVPAKAGNGYCGWLDGQFFRSLRELRFMLTRPDAASGESAFWTARYEWLGRPRTTRPDFVLDEERTVVECKPLALHSTPQVQAKAEALTRLAESRGYRYFVTDPGVPDTDELLTLIEQGRIVLTEKTAVRVAAWVKQNAA